MQRIHSLSALPPELREALDDAANSGGSVTSLLCPTCRGGRTGERSVSAWVTTGYGHLKCWRASCSDYGEVPMDPSVVIGPPKFKPKPYQGELCDPDVGMLSMMLNYYNISLVTLTLNGVKQIPREQILYFPVHGPNIHGERGGFLRYYDGTRPKVITYKATDLPFQAWYMSDPEAPLIIVEDSVSALRLWQLNINAVALLGTNLNTDKAVEIVSQDFKDVRIALDRDAFGRAVHYSRKYSWLSPILLEADIKDMQDDDIRTKIRI